MPEQRAWKSKEEPKEKFSVCKGKTAALEACEARRVKSCREWMDASVTVTVLLPPRD